MTQGPQISDAWIAERWPNQDAAEVRRRFNALMDKLGETPWRGVPGYPETMQPVLAWAALLPAQRIELLTAALADVDESAREYLLVAEKPYFGEQRVKAYESVVGDNGHGMGRWAVAITPYIKGWSLGRWFAAASPGNVGALLGELRRLADRVAGLLNYNNEQVEKRRAATTLLREAAVELRDCASEFASSYDNGAAYRSASEIAGRIETFLKEIHQ